VRAVMTAEDIRALQGQVRSIVLAEHVKAYAVKVVLATHPDTAQAPARIRRFVRYGASPRGVLSVILTAKAFALFEGRLNVSFGDLQASAAPALRHRILLNFEGEAEGVAVDDLIAEILRETPVVA
jgi:MoxR-like ATPase